MQNLSRKMVIEDREVIIEMSWKSHVKNNCKVWEP